MEALAERCLMVKRAVREELLKPRYRGAAVDSIIDDVLCAHGLEAQVCNCIYLHLQEQRLQAPGASLAREEGQPAPEGSVHGADHELDMVVEMRERWGRMLEQNVQQMCEEAGQPLVRIRLDADAEKWRAKRVQQKVRFLYEASDLVEHLRNAKAKRDGQVRAPAWGISPLRLRTPTLVQLRDRFAELCLEERQTGLDDELRGWFDEERQEEGHRLLAHGYVPLLELYAKRGIPAALRARFWLGILKLDLGEAEYTYYSELLREAVRVSFLTDELQKRDAASPDQEDQYFVFVSMVEEVLLCFSRDPQVYQATSHPAHTTLVTQGADGSKTAFPPSSVAPFRGQGQLAFPLCSVYGQSHQVYFVFRALWTRYWSRLHTFSSQCTGLLTLSLLFEELMQEHMADVSTHLIDLGVHPTSIALSWMASGFAGVLSMDQTLLLWDRVLGFDSLELLPVLAAAIFAYRRKLILQMSSADRAERIMANFTCVKIVPLLQLFLWDKETLLSSISSSRYKRASHVGRER